MARTFGGTVQAVSGASASLDVLIPPVDLGPLLAGDVVRPAVFIDLLLDQGELNIWTGLHDIEVRGVVYRGLAGFDTGVNVREGVDLDALGTDFRISGLQLKFLAVALTENYQGRLAKVYLVRSAQTGSCSTAT